MPEWQGAGVGLRFLNAICEMQAQGSPDARLPRRRTTTLFHASHPQLAVALRRDARWRQLSAVLHGNSRAKRVATLKRSAAQRLARGDDPNRPGHEVVLGGAAGYGGHFRAAGVSVLRSEGDRRITNKMICVALAARPPHALELF